MKTSMEQFPLWRREVNRLFGHESGAVAGLVPPADALIDDKGVRVSMDVPGRDRGDVEIELESDVLPAGGVAKPKTIEIRGLEPVAR